MKPAMKPVGKIVARWLPMIGMVTGAVFLTGVDCGTAADCSYNNKVYASGDSFPSEDGCNTCSCEDGAVACTARACAKLQWYRTCGDPVCHGHTADPNIPACTTEKVGDACTTAGEKCDPNDECDVRLVCATSDPTMQPGGCPISRAKYKRDIRYLDAAERDRVRDELMKVNLATYRYRATGEHGPLQLGFIIDDVGASPSVNADGETVNLYGYTSMAVAALQSQEKEIADLRAEVAALKARLDGKQHERHAR
jgi:hypothetical protein